MRLVSLVLVGSLLVIAGCDRQSKMMPLSKGAVWEYQATSGLLTRVTKIQVDSPVAVGSASGYLLTSRQGNSRLAWSGSQLIASQLAGAQFRPPIPLYADLAEGAKLAWKGQIRTAEGTRPAQGELVSAKTKEKLGTQEVAATLTTLTYQEAGRQHEIQTWFASGVGIIRQEHRSNGQLMTRLIYLSGP